MRIEPIRRPLDDSREFTNPTESPSNEHRNNSFNDLILINERKRLFSIVTNGLIWRRTKTRQAQTKGIKAMKNLVLAAAAAMFVIAAAPAFAGYSDDAHDWFSQIPGTHCHYVREPVTMSNGHVAYQTVEVCN